MMRRVRGLRRREEGTRSHDWSAGVPLGYQLAFLSMVLLLGVIVAAAYLIQTPVYGETFGGQWQVWGRTAPFVFRAEADRVMEAELIPGKPIQVIWDAAYDLPSKQGYIVSADAAFASPTVQVDIELSVDPDIPVGATGVARVREGQKRALTVFWAWLRNR